MHRILLLQELEEEHEFAHLDETLLHNRDYGGRTRFSGKAITIRCLETNQILRDVSSHQASCILSLCKSPHCWHQWRDGSRTLLRLHCQQSMVSWNALKAWSRRSLIAVRRVRGNEQRLPCRRWRKLAKAA